jgi:DNA repair protein RadD
MRVAGLSATPFRLDSGRLDEGDGKIFDEVIFDYGIGRGIADGWLSPLSSKATQTTIDVRSVGRRGGEFIASELEAAADDEAKIKAACDEIVELGADRRCWLIFCCGISHATHVRDALRERGISCEAVFGETPKKDRERIVEDFKAGQIRCLVNVMVLTTGFNVPAVDLLVMLRPTLSTGLYVQMVGRGTRNAKGKTDCLVLDFGQNVYRHGPVDQINITMTGKSNGNGAGVKVSSVKAKACPDCDELRACELDRAYEIAAVRNGMFWNVIDRRVRRADGQCVEIDRFYQTWTVNSRADAATTLKQTPMNDELPY